MEKYLVEASTDGNEIDFETVIESEGTPYWFDVCQLCDAHNCPFYMVYQLNGKGEPVEQVEC